MNSEDSGFKKVEYKRSKNNNNNNKKQDLEIKNLQRRIHSPKVDLVERENMYVIRIELPGVDVSTVKIELKDEQIVLISGSKFVDDVLPTDKIIYKESKFRDFIRRVKLPSKSKSLNDNNNISLNNGVLYLNFQKMDTVETITDTLQTLDFDNTKSWADM
jgi:HSP20 family molecular chaperone IbpA